MIKECKKHGIVEHKKRKDCNGYRCTLCCKEYNKKKSKKIIETRKQKNIELIISNYGKCQNCGYNKCIEALEFHHINPKEKEFTISKKIHLSLEKLKAETDKCVLLCGNCHREVHDNILILEKKEDKITFKYIDN